MAAVSIKWNFYVFLGELVISAAAIAIVFACFMRLKSYIAKVISVSINSIADNSQEKIDMIRVPAVIIGENNEILAANNLFRKKICREGEEPLGDDITEYLSDGNPEALFDDNGIDTLKNERWYVVFGVKNDSGAVVYFIDNNIYKTNSDLYLASRPVVAILTFDNREELEREKEDGKASRITAEVEQTIVKWVNSTSGFYKKVSGGKYIVLMEECHLKKFISEKFKILEEIRSIKINDRMNATVSMGIGSGGSTFK